MRAWLLKYWTNTRKLLRDAWYSRMSPHKWGLAIAVSFLWGTMPMLGLVTALSFFSGWALRVSIPLVVGLTFAITPVQAAMVIPFIQFGAAWFPFSDGLPTMMSSLGPWLEQVGIWQIQALGAWLTVMVPGSVILYMVVRVVFFLVGMRRTNRTIT